MINMERLAINDQGRDRLHAKRLSFGDSCRLLSQMNLLYFALERIGYGLLRTDAYRTARMIKNGLGHFLILLQNMEW